MLKKWRKGMMCCPICVKHTESLEYVIVNEETITSASDEAEFFDVSCRGLDHHMRVVHATILSEDLLLKAKRLPRRLVSSETLINLTTFSEARHSEGTVDYVKCLVSSSGGDRMTFYAKREKEAAKYFCLYLDHKGELCQLEDRSHPCTIEVKSANLHIAYNAWKTSSKIHLEANFTRTVSSLPIGLLNFTCGAGNNNQTCIGITFIS